MNKKNLKRTVVTLCAALMILAGCGSNATESMANSVKILKSGSIYANASVISLETDKATINGNVIEEFDYTWNCDPTVSHDEVKNAPAEYYTGTKPETESSVYIDHELYYYPMLDESSFKLINYDGEREWAYYYSDGENNDYIFATLPNLGQSLPTQMMHSAEEAAENKVLHITKAGTYVLRGSWKGQIKVDLGEDAFTDENAKVTLILDGADIECSVAPGVIFENVYECDNTWEDSDRKDASVDTTNAGANIVLADNSENYISGTNVFRMLKTKYKDEDSTDAIKLQKKMRKTDGALYSYMTMNIGGESTGNGKLTVDSGFEGIDSELHLSFNGGFITVNSQDDGINVNEDNVSVVSFLGGEVTINAALGAEGDGVDSNGYVAVNGGTVKVNGIRVPDSAIDSEDGIYYTRGKIIVDGKEQSYEEGSVFRETSDGGFGGKGFGGKEFGDRDFGGNGQGFEPGDFGGRDDRFGMISEELRQNFDIKSFKENVSNLPDDATLDDVLSLLGINVNMMNPMDM